MDNRKRKWIWTAVAAVVLLAGTAALLLGPSVSQGSGVKMLKRDSLLVFSGASYEAAFDANSGAIAYIKDKNTQRDLTSGNRDGALWWAFLDDDSAVNASKADSFSYKWSKRTGKLTLHYGGPLSVDATVAFGKDNRIALSAEVANGTGKTLKSFRFPYELKVDTAEIKDGLLPMLPGAKLRSAFFRESNSYDAQYPGIMFAAYTALRTTNGGALAVYDVNVKTAATVNVGFKSQVKEPGKTGIVHDFQTAVAQDAKWQTPEIIVELGVDYPQSIAGYGKLNGIDDYKTLDAKLGQSLADYAALPFYKLDISAVKDGSWDTLRQKYADALNYDGVLHLVGFQKGGHDENYPDFLPPDPKWGGDEALAAFVRDAKSRGHKIVPYTNFSWWGVNSPTLAALPEGLTLQDIAVLDKNGTAIKEDYGAHSGYVMNPSHPFTIKRIADEHAKMKAAGFDGVFEDQWGIRNAPFVYNPSLPGGTDASTAYLAGVRDYFAAADYNLYTEDGFDVLADHALGFMGSNYLWDLLGYRPKTASYTDYYPMIGMLVRDKVMLYQHDLAAETMTDNPDMLRWNAAMGFNLSADLFNGASNPWVDLAGVLQREVLSRYVAEKVTGFEELAPQVTRTDFETVKVTANAGKDGAYEVDANTALAPGGFDIAADDGSYRAGSYVRYNGADLDPGEHILAEVRQADEIRVYQPYGEDTTIRVKLGAKWRHAAAAAYTADGGKIADLPVKEADGYASVDYVALILDKKTAYVALTSASAPSGVTQGFDKVKPQTNLALGKKALSTSDTAKEFPAALATDGDPYTYWESAAKNFPQSLTLDLGESRDIKTVKLKLPPQDAWEKRDQQVEVLGSEDGEKFASIAPAQAATFDPATGNVAEIKLADGAKARYVRVVVTDNTAWPAAQLAEFEVYG
ncbi:discoidin domain-containing protein [Cohnella sp. 56]|uniref:discoidin domain-containing protein n=1 Tax=Cohnella sp. 56 TaxID=3113722 RepID=UPI0030E97356